MADPLLRIGIVARDAGVSVDTVRHYERLGVLPPAQRTASGYRLFPAATVTRIQLVQNALAVGFSLTDLAGFFRQRRGGAAPCAEVRRAGARVLARIEAQLATLEHARTQMRAVLRDWDERLRGADGGPAHLLQHLPAARAPRPPAGRAPRRA